MRWRHWLKRMGAFLGLTVLMVLLFMVGATYWGPPVDSTLPPADASATGLAMVVVCFIDTLLFGIFILRSRLYGWRLMLITAFLYYGVKTFQANIEAVYFMRNITPVMAPGLFAMTLPLALLWPPVAVWLLGKARQPAGTPTAPSLLPAMTNGLWLGKLLVLGVLLYPLLFFAFGYYVAWQSPAVRAFYGGTDPGSFLLQMRTIIVGDPFLLLFEGLRGLLWTAMAALFLWTLRGRPWPAILLLALVLALVENDTHLIPNPLMPTLVRQVHFVETASSNFIFGIIAGALLLWRPVSGQTSGAFEQQKVTPAAPPARAR